MGAVHPPPDRSDFLAVYRAASRRDLGALLAMLEGLDGAKEAEVVRTAVRGGVDYDLAVAEVQREVERRMSRLLRDEPSVAPGPSRHLGHRASLRSCVSNAIGLPARTDAKPHCVDSDICSRGKCRAASSIAGQEGLGRLEVVVLVVTRPSETILSSGTSRSGAKSPERWSSYSRRKMS